MPAAPAQDNPVTQLKRTHRDTWATGDYAEVASHIEEVPPTHLLAGVGIEPGQDVLDVATGTGNVALRAARAGARVTGLDLTPELLDVARARADEAGLEVTWVEGDAEALPFPDASFDRVLSTFGVMFAPRHEVTARELARVCRPGGRIGLVNWTPEGLIGQMFVIMGRYLPAPPSFASPPPRWGSESHVQSLFAGTGVEFEFERALTPWRFPTLEDYAAFFEDRYGPLIKTRERLSAEGTWDACRADLHELYASAGRQTGGGAFEIEAEYLLAIGEKAAG